MLEKLSEKDKKLIKTRFGDDLDNPVFKKMNKQETARFYSYLIPKVRRILGENFSNYRRPLDERISDRDCKVLDELKSNESSTINSVDVLTDDDYTRMLELLELPEFSEMSSSKEAMVTVLKLGYIDGKCFSNSVVSKLLGIESQEVVDITKKVLLDYKDHIMYDSGKPSTQSKSFNKVFYKSLPDNKNPKA